MFARSVSFHLKPGRTAEFTRLLDQDIIPTLRKQKGFQDEITFIVRGGRDAVGVSFWDKQEDADAYSRGTYPDVVKALGKVLDGTPQVENWEVSNSTFHSIGVLDL